MGPEQNTTEQQQNKARQGKKLIEVDHLPLPMFVESSRYGRVY
jgi:hypothetical protein